MAKAFEEIDDFRYAVQAMSKTEFIAKNKALKESTMIIPLTTQFLESAYSKMIGDDLELMKTGQFSWDTINWRSITQLSTLSKFSTTKSSLTSCAMMKPELYYFLDSKLITVLFPPSTIFKYCSYQHIGYGSKSYDAILGFQSNLMTILYVFHVRRDFRWMRVIDSSMAHALDSISRSRIRIENQSRIDYQKYAGDEFNIKNMVFVALENFFPTVSINYARDNHTCQLVTLQLTRFLFDVGLWTIEETYRIARVLLEKSENLLILEKQIFEEESYKKSKSANTFKKMERLFKDIKINICQILLHVILMINDDAFIQTTSTDSKAKGPSNWDRAFFNNSEINIICSSVLFNYILKTESFYEKDSIESSERNWDEQHSSVYVEKIVKILIDKDLDCFISSAELLDSSVLRFYEDNSNPSTNYNKILESLQSLMNDISTTKYYDNFSEESKDLPVLNSNGNNVIISFSKQIIEYLCLDANRVPQLPKQMNLIESNLVTHIFALLNLVENSASEEVIRGLIDIIQLLCRDNKVGQSQLLSGDCVMFYKGFIMRNPILGAFLNYKIYHLSKKSLIVFNRDSFTVIMSVYKHLLSSLTDVGPSSLRIKSLESLNLLRAVYLYNSFLVQVIELESEFEASSYDLETQRNIITFVELLIQQNHRNWSSDFESQELGAIHKLGSYLVDIPLDDMMRLSDDSIDKKCSTAEIKHAILEVVVSSMRLLNASSERYFYEESLRISTQITSTNILSDLSYLNIIQGAEIQIELLKIFNKYAVYPSNGLLNNRKNALKYSWGFSSDERKFEKKDHPEELFATEDVSPQRQDFFKLLLKNLNSIAEYSIMKKDSYRILSRYLFEGLLPIIYKTLNTIRTTYYYGIGSFLSEYEINKDMEDISSLVEVLSSECCQHLPQIFKLLNIDIEISTADLSKYNSKENDTTYLLIDDLEEDEVTRPVLYNLRKKSEYIINAIYKAYPKNMLGQITKFLRPNGSNRQGKFWKDSILKDLRYERFSTYNSIRRMELLVEGSKDNRYKGYVSTFIMYLTEKQKRLSSNDPSSNLFLNYLRKNKEAMNLIVFFVFQLLYIPIEQSRQSKPKEDFKAGFNRNLDRPDYMSEYIFAAFMESNHLIDLAKYISQLAMYDIPGIKHFLYYILEKPNLAYKDHYKIGELCAHPTVIERMNSNEEKIRDRHREALSMLYFFMRESFDFCCFKVFHDKNLDEVWRRGFLISGLFKNLCENRADYFKRFFSNFYPAINGSSLYNSTMDFFYNTQGRIKKYLNASEIWKRQSHKLSLRDKPELIFCQNRIIVLCTEMINGPCVYNQNRAVSFNIELLSGILYRVSDDVNPESSFYKLKRSVVEYFHSIIEGAGLEELNKEDFKGQFDPFSMRKEIATGINVASSISVITSMIKRLYIATKCKQNSSYRSNLLRKIEAYKQEQIANIEKAENESASVIKSNFLREHSIPTSFFDLENEIYHVTEDMCNLSEELTLKSLFSMYINEALFANNQIIELSIRIYTLLEYLSESSTFMKLFLDTRKLTIQQYYGNLMDREDRITESKSSMETELISEEIVVQMFILKITRKIEICYKGVGSPNLLNRIIYFPLRPETFYLQNETKNDALEELDLGSSRSNFQTNFCRYLLEMNGNYKFKRSSKSMYYLLKNDTLRMQKWICWIYGLIINIICLAAYKLDEKENWADRRLQAGNYESILFILSVIFGCYSLIISMLWLCYKFYHERDMLIQRFIIESESGDEQPSIWDRLSISFKAMFVDNGVINFIFHAVFSLLAILIDPVFHSFHLLTIIYLSTTTRYVVLATYTHIDQIAFTLFLAQFVIYSFSILNANNYSGQFDSTVVGEVDVCSSLLSCYSYITDLGLRNGGGIADAHELLGISDPKFGGKLIFDLSFFTLINVIALNIIFGIIIDTFGEMRSESDSRSLILKTECLICLLKNSEFEERKKKFSNHIHIEHNIWLYLFYIRYLLEKEKRMSIYEFTGEEIFIYSCYQQGNTDWMPHMNTLYLPNYTGGTNPENEKTEQAVDEVVELFEKISKTDQTCEATEKLAEAAKNQLERALRVCTVVESELNKTK